MADLITIKTFNDRVEAELAKGFLESNGINSIVTADDEGGMFAYPFTLVKGVKLMVGEKDVKKAKETLEVFSKK